MLISVLPAALRSEPASMTASQVEQGAALVSLLRPAAVLLAILSLVTGLAYPALVTLLAQAAFPLQANGSLLKQRDRFVGSALIGQPFDSPGYFWGRPSVTTPYANNASSSAASNLGPTNLELRNAIKARLVGLQAADPDSRDPVPIDLVTSSASGLDPHITPAAAYYQVNRVARVRKLDSARVRTLVDEKIEPRAFGMLGEPRVNVLRLNLALDQLASAAGG